MGQNIGTEPREASKKGSPTDIHPWIADAPPAYLRLIQTGNVRMEVDEATVGAANRTALTFFSFKDNYDLKYRIRRLGRQPTVIFVCRSPLLL